MNIRLHLDLSVALSLMIRAGISKATQRRCTAPEGAGSHQEQREKVPTETKPSDFGTEHLNCARAVMLMRLADCLYECNPVVSPLPSCMLLHIAVVNVA